ncbi:Ig-like domain-containing protein [Sorangium sp. So ce406]|uniref:Ig-like domain-containing protein n=1 Tax=Sorangium sp. So ce406 TaxID=3133311 RepID=UPI003F5C5880
MRHLLLRHCVPGLVAGAAALSTFTWTTESAACGETAPEVTALSPGDGAVDVPLNAALFAGSNLGRVAFTLREAQSGEVVPVSVSCNGFYDGNLCAAHAGPLAENTTYEWTAAMVEELDPNPGAPVWRQFTTGTAHDERTPLSLDLSVSVLERGESAPSDCGPGGPWTKVRISFSVDEPVLFDLASSQRMPVPVPEGRSEIEITMPSDAFCLAPRMLDVAGNEWITQTACVSADDSPAQPTDPAPPDETDPPAEDTATPGRDPVSVPPEPGAAGGCSVGQAGRTRDLGAASLLSLAVLALAFRPRRSLSA